MRQGDQYEDLIKRVRIWAKATQYDLLRQLEAMGLDQSTRKSGEQALYKSLKHTVRVKNLEVNRIGFTFSRHGIFIEHGVGDGRLVASPEANAAKRPWLSLVLPAAVDKLGNELMESYADVVANELKFLIPGIIDTTIKR